MGSEVGDGCIPIQGGDQSECDIRENFDVSEYIRINKITRMNIRINSYHFFDTNECPNKYSY